MSKIIRLISLILFLFIIFVAKQTSPNQVQAEICYANRVYNQHFCKPLFTETCTLKEDRCSTSGADCSITCTTDPYGVTTCSDSCSGGEGTCREVCVDWSTGGLTCEVSSGLASCSSAPECEADITATTCSVSGDTCTEGNVSLTYGCWGPGDPDPVCGDGTCNGTETNATCPGDCPLVGSFCGDGTCDAGEDCTCSDCPACSAVCGNGTCDVGEDCTCSDCPACPPPPPPPPPPPDSLLSGTVYNDPSRQAVLVGDNCTLAGATGQRPGNGSTVSNSAGSSAVTPGSGAWGNIQVPSGPSYLTTLNIGNPANWVCTCPAGCTYGIDTPPNAIRDYYVSQARPAWFQTVGGDLHTNLETTPGTLVLRNTIPNSCNGSCLPYTSLLDSQLTTNSTGIISVTAGDIDTSADAGNQSTNIDEEGRNRLAINHLDSPLENYTYFKRLFDLPLNLQDDFGAGFTNASKPTSPGLNVPNAYYAPSGLTVRDNQWHVPVGESITVFVNGDLTFDRAGGGRLLTNVVPGGFLAFIVSGNITVTSPLGRGIVTSTDSNLEGIFIADGTITIESVGDPASDLKFVGEGTFVGWQGINLNRDYRNTNNNSNPTDLFTFRPDLIINAPDEFKKPNYLWRELAP